MGLFSFKSSHAHKKKAAKQAQKKQKPQAPANTPAIVAPQNHDTDALIYSLSAYSQEHGDANDADASLASESLYTTPSRTSHHRRPYGTRHTPASSTAATATTTQVTPSPTTTTTSTRRSKSSGPVDLDEDYESEYLQENDTFYPPSSSLEEYDDDDDDRYTLSTSTTEYLNQLQHAYAQATGAAVQEHLFVPHSNKKSITELSFPDETQDTKKRVQDKPPETPVLSSQQHSQEQQQADFLWASKPTPYAAASTPFPMATGGRQVSNASSASSSIWDISSASDQEADTLFGGLTLSNRQQQDQESLFLSETSSQLEDSSSLFLLDQSATSDKVQELLTPAATTMSTSGLETPTNHPQESSQLEDSWLPDEEEEEDYKVITPTVTKVPSPPPHQGRSVVLVAGKSARPKTVAPSKFVVATAPTPPSPKRPLQDRKTAFDALVQKFNHQPRTVTPPPPSIHVTETSRAIAKTPSPIPRNNEKDQAAVDRTLETAFSFASRDQQEDSSKTIEQEVQVIPPSPPRRAVPAVIPRTPPKQQTAEIPPVHLARSSSSPSTAYISFAMNSVDDYEDSEEEENESHAATSTSRSTLDHDDAGQPQKPKRPSTRTPDRNHPNTPSSIPQQAYFRGGPMGMRGVLLEPSDSFSDVSTTIHRRPSHDEEDKYHTSLTAPLNCKDDPLCGAQPPTSTQNLLPLLSENVARWWVDAAKLLQKPPLDEAEELEYHDRPDHVPPPPSSNQSRRADDGIPVVFGRTHPTTALKAIEAAPVVENQTTTTSKSGLEASSSANSKPVPPPSGYDLAQEVAKDEEDDDSVESGGAVLLTQGELELHLKKLEKTPQLPPSLEGGPSSASDLAGFVEWKYRQEQKARHLKMLHRQQEKAKKKVQRRQEQHGQTLASKYQASVDLASPTSNKSSRPPLPNKSKQGRKKRESRDELSTASSARGKKSWSWLGRRRRQLRQQEEDTSTKDATKVVPLADFLSTSSPKEEEGATNNNEEDSRDVTGFSLAPLVKEMPHLQQQDEHPSYMAQQMLRLERRKQQDFENQRQREEQEEQDRIRLMKEKAVAQARERERRKDPPSPALLHQTSHHAGRAPSPSVLSSQLQVIDNRNHGPPLSPYHNYTISKTTSLDDSERRGDAGSISGDVSKQSTITTSSSTLLLSPCILCETAERTHIAMPCMHYSFCGDCVEDLYRKHGGNSDVACPVCKTTNIAFTKVNL